MDEAARIGDDAPRAGLLGLAAGSPARRGLLWSLSLISGALLLALASRRLELLPASIEIVRGDLLAWAIALHLPYAAVRALRLRYALDPLVAAASRGRLRRLSPAILHGSGLLSFAVIMLLPLRLGELSRPLLLQQARIPGVGLAEAISAVATERVVDGLLVVGLLFGGLALTTPSAGAAAIAEVQGFGLVMAAVFVCALVALIGVAAAPEAAIRRLRLERRGALGGRAARVLRHLAAAIRPLGRPAQGIPFIAWSLVYWALTVLQLWLVLRAVGLELDPAAAAAIVAAIGLSIQLPGGPAQAGSFQVGALAGLGLFVAPAAIQGPGSSFSALMYLISFGGTLLLALPGAWLLRRR
ncbi:MAG: flippase-like domain-containing protein [Myxococcales bacterium]|nr:flippase-like domain-containing protein [Myxococcales bacterium]